MKPDPIRNRVVGEEDKDPVPDIYRIITESKNQLMLEDMGKLVFWVFERAAWKTFRHSKLPVQPFCLA